MLRSVSIHLMWTSLSFPERAKAAAAAGFDLVDLWDWRNSDIDDVGKACRDSGIGIDGFFGNRDFSLCDREQQPAALEEIARSLEVAVRVGARQLHIFSNAIRPGGIVVPSPAVAPAALFAACADGLTRAADIVKGSGVTLALEHLNTVYLPGYLWGDVDVTTQLTRELDRPQLGVVFDAFHQQLCGGRLAARLEAALPWLIRFDVAEVPNRYEPGAGEIDFVFLRDFLDRAGWDGIISFETVPSDGSTETAVAAIDRIFPREWSQGRRVNGKEPRGGAA